MLRICCFFIISFFFLISAHAKTSVYGTVTGVDDKPIQLAHVYLTYPSDDNPVRSVVVQRDGKYKIEIDTKGLWILHFTGLFYHEYPLAVFCNDSKDIKLDVKLRTYNYSDNFSTAKVVGNFNDWALPRGILLKKSSDGTYSAIVDNKSDTVKYSLINVRTGGKVEGTNADGYIPNGVDPKGIEGYTSFLIKKKGKVKIVFDPQKLIRSNQPSGFKFTPEDSFESIFAHAYAILEDTRQKYNSLLYAHLAAFKFNFKFDFTPFIDSVETMMEFEPGGLIHQVLQLSYFGLKYMSNKEHYIDVKTAKQTLKDIPPSSVVWSLEPEYIFNAMDNAAFTKPERTQYINEVLKSNPMARTKAVLLHNEIERKFHSLQYIDILPYLSILLDQVGDSPEAIADGKTFSRYIKLKAGSDAPEFSVRSLSDSTHYFTNKSFRDKYYLLNFWSSTNPASIDEIEHLKKEYKKYGIKKLNILSVSLDSISYNASNVIKTKINIPWDIAFAPNEFENKICKSFEVYSIPKSILINPKGKIVAAGWELNGENLKETLKKILEK